MELKEVSDLISMIDVADGKLEVHIHWGGFDEDMKEALNIARKSLEAWEKVKDDIRQIYFTKPITVRNEVLAIIDKHLSEVSE